MLEMFTTRQNMLEAYKTVRQANITPAHLSITAMSGASPQRWVWQCVSTFWSRESVSWRLESLSLTHTGWSQTCQSLHS